MIISNEEIAVHIKNIRNLSNLTNGRYQLRLSLTIKNAQHRIVATPLNLIQKELIASDNRSEFDQECFLSRSFPLKSGAPVQLNEIYIFKLKTPLNGQCEPILSLNCELLLNDTKQQRLVNTYSGIISSSSLHEYLQIDFYETAPCQLVGSFHRCHYQFQFNSGNSGIDLKGFCEKHCSNKPRQLLQFLQRESHNNYQNIVQYYQQIAKKEPTNNKINNQKIKQIILNSQDVPERDIETQADQELTQSQVGFGKKRKRIFSINQPKMEKYQQYQQNLHQNAQKIYSVWRELIVTLFNSESSQYFTTKKQKYRCNLKEKVGESVTRFHGKWDLDIFNEETTARNRLADKLRSQNKEDDVDLPNSDLLKIINENFFTITRPIFFEEKAERQLSELSNEPEELLVVLVHGLGACRLDMQKLKVQLRRYYQGKVRVYCSSSNEGRTEGDIDSMGLRLAAEIEYQLNKYMHIPKVCLLGHSMGGIIIRSALPRLQKYKQHFHSFISFSSPHLGYTYSTSKLVDAGLWIINTVKKCTSILQLTMEDHQNIEQTFLYKLSQKPGLTWFKKVVFFGSHQDHYVPFHSARIQHHQQSLSDERRNLRKGKVYNQMIRNILDSINVPIIRLDVNFCIPEQNLNTLIGRAAHISFITNVEMARMLVLSGKHYFF